MAAIAATGDLGARPATITASILVVHGTSDPLVPPAGHGHAGSPVSSSPGWRGAIGVNRVRSGLRSISGVPSRQSRPRTKTVAPSTLTSLTIDVPIGLGRTGVRSEKVPRAMPSLRGLCRTRSRRDHAASRAPRGFRTRRCRRGPRPTARTARCGRSGRRGGPAAGRSADRSRACGCGR